MKVLLVAATIAAISTGVATASESRQPLIVSGLIADGWGDTSSNDETYLEASYSGISSLTCYGILIKGDFADSSWIRGLDRDWDKFYCFGVANNGKRFSLISDPKKGARIIYRLHGISLSELRGYG